MSKDFFCVLQSSASLELLVLLPINAIISSLRANFLQSHRKYWEMLHNEVLKGQVISRNWHFYRKNPFELIGKICAFWGTQVLVHEGFKISEFLNFPP